jgi:hypothetical protein
MMRDLKLQQNQSKLKERYSNKSLYMAMSKEYGYNQEAWMQSKLNTKKKAYVSRDVEKLFLTEYESINHINQNSDALLTEISDSE